MKAVVTLFGSILGGCAIGVGMGHFASLIVRDGDVTGEMCFLVLAILVGIAWALTFGFIVQKIAGRNV